MEAFMIVFPMAGLSSRFFKAGYEQPKYMLEYGGKTVFEHVVEGFDAYRAKEPFLFICRSDFNTPGFVRNQLTALGFGRDDFEIKVLDEPTRGQAETVALGLEGVPVSLKDRLTIFNVDTVRHDFQRSVFPKESTGYLEVFEGEGDHWSFVKPRNPDAPLTGRVGAVREKDRISSLCSNGLYEFETGEVFMHLYAAQLALSESHWTNAELFVAPLYQIGLDQGLTFHYVTCAPQKMDFCGVPSEYEALRKRFGP
jgi:hypothetical protein